MTSASVRRARRRIDGVLLLDKPAGISSNGALQRAKYLYAADKAGHTGTLDPLATGLLVVCFGEATKFAQALIDAPKAYVAEVRFGIATTTGDAEGEVLREAPAAFSRAELEAALVRFIGVVSQVPPRYAALKYQGRNYYEYARSGVEIPRAARDVEITALEVLDWQPPLATLRVACGSGTYVRVLAEDIALALGSCAHLTQLRRTAAGPFAIVDAITLDALAELPGDTRDARLLPADAPLAAVPRLDLDEASARALSHGRATVAPSGAAGRYRCYGIRGAFLGLAEAAGGTLKPVRLARSDEARLA